MSPETAASGARVPAPSTPSPSSVPSPRASSVPPARGPGEGTVGVATALLDSYRPGADSRFLASPTRTLLAHGARHRVPHGTGGLGERAAEAIAAARDAGVARPVVVGAVPFRADEPAALVVPEAVRWAPPLRQDPLIALPGPEPAGAADWRVSPVPDTGTYEKAVGEAVARLERGELRKVVLARTLELRSARGAEPDVPAMLQRLARRDPGGYTFALPTGPGRTLLGASPELLVSRRGRHVVANPLAGSAPRSADVAEDVRAAARLLESAKDLHEHAVVVDAVRARLAPSCAELSVPARPTLVRTATMWHLSTTVTGTLRDDAGPGPSSLDLALALHPTPAVCGTPTDDARAAIGELEPFERGFFTGMVGWADEHGDGEWVVTLRCAEAEESTLRLFAGAGVVAASRPEAETAETAAKFRTFLDAVGAERGALTGEEGQQ